MRLVPRSNDWYKPLPNDLIEETNTNEEFHATVRNSSDNSIDEWYDHYKRGHFKGEPQYTQKLATQLSEWILNIISHLYEYIDNIPIPCINLVFKYEKLPLIGLTTYIPTIYFFQDKLNHDILHDDILNKSH